MRVALVVGLALAFAGPVRAQQSQIVVPTKITAVPADSFRRGSSVTLRSTFSAGEAKAPCPAGSAFVIRIYDATIVKVNQPSFSTAYIAQAVAPVLPLTGPNALTIEKTFGSFFMPSGKPKLLPRVYTLLFQMCVTRTPKGIDPTTGTVIWDTKETGRPIGDGRFFRANCAKVPCVYQPE